jgi:hypothetical protein
MAAAAVVVVMILLLATLVVTVVGMTVLAAGAGLLIAWLRKKGSFAVPGRRAPDDGAMVHGAVHQS